MLRSRCESIQEQNWPATGEPDWPSVDAVVLCGADDSVVERVALTRTRVGKAAVLVIAPLSHAGRISALELGADDCLPEDVAGQELHRRMLTLRMIAPDTLKSGYCEVGDLRVNLTSSDVWRDSKHIRLGVREYRLLRILAVNAYRTLSRGELVEHVWGHDADHNDNVLDVYIHRLRSKVDKPFPTHLIQTVHGIGYRLADD